MDKTATDRATDKQDNDPRVYMRILTRMRTQITEGTLEPGAQAPSIASLCGQFGCARQTAGKALRALTGEGLLVRYPGLGYYVARR